MYGLGGYDAWKLASPPEDGPDEDEDAPARCDSCGRESGAGRARVGLVIDGEDKVYLCVACEEARGAAEEQRDQGERGVPEQRAAYGAGERR